MRKIRILAAGTVLILLTLTACSSPKKSAPERTELVYTVEDIRNLPQELQNIIEEHKKQEIRLSYTDGSDLYLIRGYGEQQTGGYSIAVRECSEDEQSILLDTMLIGPHNPEEMKEEPSYPYVVLKTEQKEKEIIIQ